jgi:pyroglutamyl-peptidase
MLRRNRKSCVLITGFGRFPGAAFNPSGPLAKRLARLRRPALSDFQLVGHVFPTSYAAVDRDLPALLKQHQPDIVLMFGLATRSKAVRIETTARNILARFPDVTGFSPGTRRIAAGAAAARARAPTIRMLNAARRWEKAAMLSRNAGSYLCNYVYWRALEAARRPGGPKLVAFVHIPPLRRSGRKRPSRDGEARLPSLANLTGAGGAILAAIAAALPATH